MEIKLGTHEERLTALEKAYSETTSAKRRVTIVSLAAVLCQDNDAAEEKKARRPGFQPK